MKTNLIISSVSALLLFASLWLAVFAVPQNHEAIRFRLGRIVAADYDPGLHFKLPLLESVKRFDRRIVSLDLPPERFLTAEKKNVIVDALALWRIDDVVRFYTSVQGDRQSANLRLGQILKDVMRGQFGRRQIRELVAEDRTRLRDLLLAEAQEAATDLGIRLVDLRIKRIDLPEEVSASVFRRMEAERSRVAKELRSQGAEAAERIRADADKQRQILLAEAYRQSQRLKGIGDARATEIYATAYAEDPKFFAFLRRHQAYRRGLVQPGDKLVLKPDAPFFRDFAKDE
ncbi:modulator of FtsH protease HflC [Methylomarinovum caldicuralii]|uniref:Protein HflC n=1 Tax=Methylomarinovum caldicuralii TaxID=438856 RepID=A0AAU9CR88_9GAMM|nr:protease modulator HflC [Methylomarinovum caldicuralii]BCX82478.1 modulator of FtsH protease HflC [Methylomarinovum caldicuralii]